MTGNDLGFLYQLLAQRPTYTSISHLSMPSWDEHCQFWAHPIYKEQAIVMMGDTQAGYYYVSRMNEIGLHLIEMCRGHGIGPAVIRHIVESHPGEAFLANVSLYNERSQKMFRRLGWIVIQQTYRSPISPLPV